MTSEGETALFKRLEDLDKKQDTILICLTGKPLETPPIPGLVQISEAHTTAIKDLTNKNESLEAWRAKVKMRFAQISGGVVVIGFMANRAYEALLAWFTAKHD